MRHGVAQRDCCQKLAVARAEPREDRRLEKQLPEFSGTGPVKFDQEVRAVPVCVGVEAVRVSSTRSTILLSHPGRVRVVRNPYSITLAVVLDVVAVLDLYVAWACLVHLGAVVTTTTRTHLVGLVGVIISLSLGFSLALL